MPFAQLADLLSADCEPGVSMEISVGDVGGFVRRAVYVVSANEVNDIAASMNVLVGEGGEVV